MKKVLYILILSLIGSMQPAVAQAPKLVVNIVFDQMRYDYFTRFAGNLSPGGFRKLLDEGMVFTEARYGFMQTFAPVTLATLTTGADPSTHGVISRHWIDRTQNSEKDLIRDFSARGLETESGKANFSPANLIAPVLGDVLKTHSPDSKVVTIATDPYSAVVMGGFSSGTYWMDADRAAWVSSTAYMNQLPSWVRSLNNIRLADQYLGTDWSMMYPKDRYTNRVYSIFQPGYDSRLTKLNSISGPAVSLKHDYPSLLDTYVGNILVTEAAKAAVTGEDLGSRETTDLLNVFYDSPGRIVSRYGWESLEAEDMFYRLDRDIADLIESVTTRVGASNVLFIVTAAGGGSDSFDVAHTLRERFNSSQFKAIINGYLNAQYGEGNWVVDYTDRQLYLDRKLILSRGLKLQDVQENVAAFALQFRGISHALAATSLQSGYFGSGYGRMMQNGFYPRRSGDVLINLVPGCIEENEHARSATGSMYNYDTHVPLIIMGAGVGSGKIFRDVDMKDIAPTLSYIMKVGRPAASEGKVIEELRQD